MKQNRNRNMIKTFVVAYISKMISEDIKNRLLDKMKWLMGVISSMVSGSFMSSKERYTNGHYVYGNKSIDLASKIKVLKLYKAVETTPLPDNRYIVNKDLPFKGGCVPLGYVTNGADIPRPLWIVKPPNSSLVLPAVIPHDYLCDLASLAFNNGEDIDTVIEMYQFADTTFKSILEDLMVAKLTLMFYSVGVSIFTNYIRRHVLTFYKYRKKELLVYPRNKKLIEKVSYKGRHP